jgi:hypothetical protein
MMDTKEKLVALTSSLLIHEDDRELWAVLIDVLAEREQEAILALLTAQPDKMDMLNRNLQAKLDALLASDQDAWQDLVEQEIAQVINS